MCDRLPNSVGHFSGHLADTSTRMTPCPVDKFQIRCKGYATVIHGPLGLATPPSLFDAPADAPGI